MVRRGVSWVANTGLGLMAFATFLMVATSPLIAGAIDETAGFDAALHYIAGLVRRSRLGVRHVAPFPADRNLKQETLPVQNGLGAL